MTIPLHEFLSKDYCNLINACQILASKDRRTAMSTETFY